METQFHVLLTGAGFTHNFGAPLAADVSSVILSHQSVKDSPRLRAALIENSNYEDVYYEVMTDDSYSKEERQAITEAVSTAYDHIDETVRSYTFTKDSPYPVNIYGVQEFIDLFSGDQNLQGYFFTLNQDLFLERHYYNGTTPTMPGTSGTRGFSSLFAHAKLEEGDKLELPDRDELEPRKAEVASKPFLYVKLHGSSNWYSADGQRRLVIGRGKKAQIEQEPALAWYFEMFENVVGVSARRLLTVGYGFADEHINDVIADGVARGLEVHLLSPSSQSATQQKVCSSHRGQEIWRGLYGYYPYSLRQMFPSDQSKTAAWKHVRQGFFESES